MGLVGTVSASVDKTEPNFADLRPDLSWFLTLYASPILNVSIHPTHPLPIYHHHPFTHPQNHWWFHCAGLCASWPSDVRSGSSSPHASRSERPGWSCAHTSRTAQKDLPVLANQRQRGGSRRKWIVSLCNVWPMPPILHRRSWRLPGNTLQQ